jgi:hypothetical protein
VLRLSLGIQIPSKVEPDVRTPMLAIPACILQQFYLNFFSYQNKRV